MGVKKNALTMDRDERAKEVEKLIPVAKWFAGNLPKSILLKLGGFEEATQKFLLIAFKTVEQAKFAGVNPATVFINRLKWDTGQMLAETNVIRRQKFRKYLNAATQRKIKADVEPIVGDDFISKGEGPHEIVERAEIVRMVRAEIEKLTGRHGDAFRRSFFDGASHRQIAKDMGVSKQRVTQLIAKCHKEIRSNLSMSFA